MLRKRWRILILPALAGIISLCSVPNGEWTDTWNRARWVKARVRASIRKAERSGFSPMEKKWWMDKTIYQIYPKSFCDSNGDGIGDIPGIIGKLDYLKNLGVDILWISPCYKSPFVDQGYDISDYYAIDPCFGTMEDMERLILEAKKRGLYIIMDLVVNHCSSEHPWFQEACRNPDGESGTFFYIRDAGNDGRPTNWRSYFGGSAWSPLPGHPDKVYLHSFHEKQPDLNWENPTVRKEIYRMMNWWLEKGLSGYSS